MAFASEAVLTALDAYLSRGGGSRGARAVCDPHGSDVPVTQAGPLEAFRFRAERPQDRAEKIAIRFEDGAFACSFQRVRRHDHSRGVFRTGLDGISERRHLRIGRLTGHVEPPRGLRRQR
jgi:succinate dehydrogenase / fumarate reductase, flavoprotein subunit